MRALCNGKTLAFQAKDTGSIPVARSNLDLKNIINSTSKKKLLRDSINDNLAKCLNILVNHFKNFKFRGKVATIPFFIILIKMK